MTDFNEDDLTRALERLGALTPPPEESRSALERARQALIGESSQRGIEECVMRAAGLRATTTRVVRAAGVDLFALVLYGHSIPVY